MFLLRVGKNGIIAFRIARQCPRASQTNRNWRKHQRCSHKTMHSWFSLCAAQICTPALTSPAAIKSPLESGCLYCFSRLEETCRNTTWRRMKGPTLTFGGMQSFMQSRRSDYHRESHNTSTQGTFSPHITSLSYFVVLKRQHKLNCYCLCV